MRAAIEKIQRDLSVEIQRKKQAFTFDAHRTFYEGYEAAVHSAVHALMDGRLSPAYAEKILGQVQDEAHRIRCKGAVAGRYWKGQITGWRIVWAGITNSPTPELDARMGRRAARIINEGGALVSHFIESQSPDGTWAPEGMLVHTRYWTGCFADYATCYYLRDRAVRLRSADGRVLLVVRGEVAP